MLKREKYLRKIRDFYDETTLIKIIYGLRRAGKSVILMQIIDEINYKLEDILLRYKKTNKIKTL